MIQVKISIGSIILVSLLCFSCKAKNSNANTGKDNADSNTAISTASSSGDASFSCKIDGRDFSGKGNGDYLSAFKSGKGTIKFVLANIEAKQQGIPEQLSFTVADHGTTKMHNSNSTDNGNYSANYNPRDYTDAFGFREVTVTVPSSDASGIKGTFSGTLFDPQNKKEISVTEGKFNLPWSPYSKK
ncbi:MAG: hypothetical protein ABI416_17985 [Ginsengibacter sp.]